MSDLRTLLHERLPSAPVVFDGDPGYDDARATWNVLTQYRPLGIVQPGSTAEVQAVIACARQAGVSQIVSRSGGHSFEGASLGGRDGSALVVDLERMNGVSVDPGQEIATVDGGALLGDIYREAWNDGRLMLPGGNCVTVGVGGQAQCGGYGHYSRRYGILTDRVLRMEVVTADGSVLTADDNTNQDLFWALRGNGTGSYGVITKITLRLNQAPAAVANFSLKYRLSDTDVAQVLTAIQDYSLAAPTAFNPMVIVWLGNLELAGCIAADTEQERDALIADMREKLPQPTESYITPMSYLESLRRFSMEQTSAPWNDDLTTIKRERTDHLRYMKIKAAFVPDPFSAEFIEKFADMAHAQATTGLRVQLLGLDPASGLPADATAIKVRGCTWLMGMSSCVLLDEAGDTPTLLKMGHERDQWLHDCYELFYPHTVGGYIGDDDLDEAGNGRDLFASYFGDHLPRLKQIKRRYDPDNIFHHTMSIPVG